MLHSAIVSKKEQIEALMLAISDLSRDNIESCYPISLLFCGRQNQIRSQLRTDSTETKRIPKGIRESRQFRYLISPTVSELTIEGKIEFGALSNLTVG